MKKFTLIELLIVVAIIGILVSILMPSLHNAREKARRAVCASNISQNIRVMHLYAKDNNGRSWDSDWHDSYGLSAMRYRNNYSDSKGKYDMRKFMTPYLVSGKDFNDIITDDVDDIVTWGCPSNNAKALDHVDNTGNVAYMNYTYFPGNRYPFTKHGGMTHDGVDSNWDNLPVHISLLSNFVVQQDVYVKSLNNKPYHYNHGKGEQTYYLSSAGYKYHSFHSKTSASFTKGSGSVLGWGDGSATWKNRVQLQDVGRFHRIHNSKRLWSLPPRD